VAALASKPVVQFACGANHVLALTGECFVPWVHSSSHRSLLMCVRVCVLGAAGGELLSWGQNKDKQLGRDDSKEKGPVGRSGFLGSLLSHARCCLCPLAQAAVSSVEGKSVAGLSCGKLYSAAVVGGGKVLTWGNGARGVLAHGDGKSK
jgi:alpha-tubulin suppressor-like RCC1 family protein